MENREDVISYIGEKCESIVRLVFRMKITREKRIRSVNRHLVEVAKSDVDNNEISIGLYQDVSSFIKGNENKLLQHIIDKYRLLMLEQKLDKTKRKLEKTEHDNRTLGERNVVLKRQKTKLEGRWIGAHSKCMAMRAENASLGARQKVLAQELRVFNEGVLQEQRDANACLAAENIGLEKALAAANVNLDKKLDQNPGLTCPVTMELFKNAVYCSDEHTYERDAITKWLREKGTSPLTREVMWIVGPNRAIQDALTPSP